MFHSETSYLIKAHLQYIVTYDVFNEKLSAEEKDELLKLLPGLDKVNGKHCFGFSLLSLF